MRKVKYKMIRSSVVSWYEKLSFNGENVKVWVSKNIKDALVIEFDFQNCLAQLSVIKSDYNPYRYISFLALDIETGKLCFYFYDSDDMMPEEVIQSLDKAIQFCEKYENTFVTAEDGDMENGREDFLRCTDVP